MVYSRGSSNSNVVIRGLWKDHRFISEIKVQEREIHIENSYELQSVSKEKSIIDQNNSTGTGTTAAATFADRMQIWLIWTVQRVETLVEIWIFCNNLQKDNLYLIFVEIINLDYLGTFQRLFCYKYKFGLIEMQFLLSCGNTIKKTPNQKLSVCHFV